MNFNASQPIHDQPQQQPQHRPPQPRQPVNPAIPGNNPQLQLQHQQQQQQQQHIAQLQQHQQQQQQQQPHPQGHVAMNGMNGANMAVGPGMSMPTPAGHQAELNYIYSMVEELSKQLADNRKVTEDIVNGLGKVRTKAKTNGVSNGELIDAAADELQTQEESLDAQISLLTESLEKAKHSRDQNATLLAQYANALAVMLKQFHEYKTKHVADVASWHRSYRTQLDEARRENSRLREQIWEMQTHAATANESLRKFRSKYDEDEKRWDGRVASVAAKQEIRFWKRMAMPELEDDDTYWSGDDDLIDPAEKERLRELEQRAVQEQMMAESQAEDSDGGPQQSPFQHMGVMGGIAMQREDTSLQQPAPPPRPLSAASSTGSTGH